METAQEVVEKQNKLDETIIQHGRTRGRLNDLELTLAQDRLQRRREFTEERSRASTALNDFMLEGEMMGKKNKMKRDELTIQELEQKKRLLRARKELEELQKPPPPSSEPAKKTTRGRSTKQKARDDAQKKYEREIARIGKDKKLSAEAKEDLKKSAAKDREVELEKIDKMP